MNELVDLAILGGGPAGLAAAAEATKLGVQAVLVDAFPRLGGQYFKQTAPELTSSPDLDREGRLLLKAVRQGRVRVLPNTVVWGLFGGPGHGEEGYLLRLYGPGETPRSLRGKKVILAPGAYDRPIPFPGWTLPGVMTAGAALTMVKHERVLPGRRVVLSGTGPLQFVLAHHLIDAGAEVPVVLDANPFPWTAWRYVGAAWGQWARLREGWHAWRAMRGAGTRVLWGRAIMRVEGEGSVERVTIQCLSGVESEEQVVAADTVCLGYGFSPAVQLSRQAGCEHIYRPGKGGHTPVRDEWLQTTRPGLFAVGDAAGIRGKDVAMLEGRLAAIGAGRQLGASVSSQKISEVRRRLARERRFAAMLDDLFPVPVHLQDMLTDDTIVCRCEEVTVREIRQAIAEGAATVSAVRMLTRAGMGRCQGRMCGHSIAALLARDLARAMEDVDQVTPRPPVVPVPMEGMKAEG